MMELIPGTALDFFVWFLIFSVIASFTRKRGKPWPTIQVLLASGALSLAGLIRHPEVRKRVKDNVDLFYEQVGQTGGWLLVALGFALVFWYQWKKGVREMAEQDAAHLEQIRKTSENDADTGPRA